MLDFAETLASKSQVEVPSCRTDLIQFYSKRGYEIVEQVPMERFVPVETISRPNDNLKMVILHKENELH